MFNNQPQPPIAPPGSSPSFSREPHVHILDRLSVLHKYRRIVGVVFVLVVGAMMLQTYTTPNMYRALVRIVIEDERSATAGFNDVETGYRDPELYRTRQFRILKGRDLARSVVRKLDLANNQEFNGKGPRPAGIRTALSAVKQRFVVLFDPPPPVPPAADETADEGALVDAFLPRVTVDPIRASRLVDVGFEATDPKFAAQAVNTLAEQFVERNLSVVTSGSNNVRIINRAEEPNAPYSPDPRRNLFIAIVLGLSLGVATAVGIDYLDDTIKTPEDITRKLKLPFLGLVPSVAGEKLPILSGPVPHDFGEAYRAIRTSLVFSSGNDEKKVIAVTSAQPLEGKTTTACNLAMALAFGGSRVLLIDADMRRPGMHKIMGLRNDIGLSHLLVGRARAREAIQRTHDPNLWVLSAGRTPPNPSELLSSERMKRLIDNLSSGPFDWVIIDTPPVLAVTDAVIIAPLVSGVAFVLGAEMTRRRLAERAVETLLASTPRVLGCVLTRVGYDRNKYYYSRFYGSQYKSYDSRATSAA